MRSTNKRSRSKPNRPKTLGNIVNRVFDSSGPEGKVRGTPQQIIEKYQVLARDAQLSNDRVAAENFQQHAEHYTRLLAQAQREMLAEQEARRQSQEDRSRQGQGQDDRGQDRGQDRNQDRGPRQDNRRPDPRRHGDDNGFGNGNSRDNGAQDSFSVQDVDTSADSTRLVETPESRAPEPVESQATPAPQAEQKPKPVNRRKPRAPKPEAPSEGQSKPDSGAAVPTEVEAKPKTRRYTRKPRDTEADGPAKVEPSSSAAE